MEKLPGKIGLYLLMLLIVGAALKMKGADAKTGGMPPGQEGQEHEHGAEDIPPGIPVLLEFTSPTCDICKEMHPLMDKLREEYAGKVAIVEILVNSAEAQQIADSYKVEAFPSFFLLNNKDDKIVMQHFEGGVPEEMMRKILDEAPTMKPMAAPGGGEPDPHGAAPEGDKSDPHGDAPEGGKSDPYGTAPAGGGPGQPAPAPGGGSEPPAK